MDEAFLASLSPGDAHRIAIAHASYVSPDVLEALLGDSLPPAGVIDPGARERLLVALAASARAFACELAEAAVALQRDTAGSGGGAVSAGSVQEAWRRVALNDGVLGVGAAAPLGGAAGADAAPRKRRRVLLRVPGGGAATS